MFDITVATKRGPEHGEHLRFSTLQVYPAWCAMSSARTQGHNPPVSSTTIAVCIVPKPKRDATLLTSWGIFEVWIRDHTLITSDCFYRLLRITNSSLPTIYNEFYCGRGFPFWVVKTCTRYFPWFFSVYMMIFSKEHNILQNREKVSVCSLDLRIL